jgi:hypothetical protein
MKYFPTTLALIVLLSYQWCHAQNYSYSGKVMDSKTKKPLAFVALTIAGQNKGVQTDIDGKFKISSANSNERFRVTYVGYESKIITLDHHLTNEIYIKEIAYTTAEVQVIAGENPAHRIIRKATEKRKLNNPEKQTSFKYTSYNKFYVTVKKDSAENRRYNFSRLDSTNREVFLKKKDSVIRRTDSLELRTDSIFKSMNLFMTESVTERIFLYPDLNNEVIKASKVSGFKNPQFVLLASQFQSFSFYTDYITVLDKNFLSPISPGSTGKYFFNIEDTLYTHSDSVFVISYKPRNGKNFDGLKGLIYINTNGYAVQNVIAEPAEPMMFSIRIQQQYELINNKFWFPTQLNTDIDMGRAVMVNARAMIIVGRTYLKDIEVGVQVRKRDLTNIEIDYDVRSIQNSSEILDKHRIDTLSSKEKQTYHVIDSVGKEENLDKYAAIGKIIAEGKIPFGYINFDLDKIIKINKYEGLRLGVGISTSDKFSKYVSLNTYGAYGFKDKAFKYGGGVDFHISKRRGLLMYTKYQNDVIESGGTKIRMDKGLLFDVRNFIISNMDKIELKEAGLTFRSLNYLTTTVFVNEQDRMVTNTYRFMENDQLIDRFNVTEVGVSFRYAFREKLMRQANALISMGTKYPVMFLQISNGFTNLSDAKVQYLKYDLKIQKSFLIRNAGKTNLTFHAGYIDGNAAAPFSYYGRANDFRLSGKESFETMKMNEFLSSQYAALFFEHNFAKLLYQSKHFQPQLSVLTNIGIGKLDHPDSHTGIDYKTMEKGYYESGLKLSNLLTFKSNIYDTGFGVTVLYKYGPYASAKPEDNLALKLNMIYVF